MCCASAPVFSLTTAPTPTVSFMCCRCTTLCTEQDSRKREKPSYRTLSKFDIAMSIGAVVCARPRSTVLAAALQLYLDMWHDAQAQVDNHVCLAAPRICSGRTFSRTHPNLLRKLSTTANVIYPTRKMRAVGERSLTSPEEVLFRPKMQKRINRKVPALTQRFSLPRALPVPASRTPVQGRCSELLSGRAPFPPAS